MTNYHAKQQLELLLSQDEHGVRYMYEVPLVEQVAVAINGLPVPYASAQVAHLQNSAEVPLYEQPMHFVVSSGMRERYALAMRPIFAVTSHNGAPAQEMYIHDTHGIPELYHSIGKRMLAAEFVSLQSAENELLQVEHATSEQLWYVRLWAAGAEHMRCIKEAVQIKHTVNDINTTTRAVVHMQGYSADVLSHLSEPPVVAAKDYLASIRAMCSGTSKEAQAFIRQPMQQAVQNMYFKAISQLTKTIVDVYKDETMWDITGPLYTGAHETHVQQVRDAFLGDVRFAIPVGYSRVNAALVPTAALTALTSEGMCAVSSYIARSVHKDLVGVWLDETSLVTATPCSVMPGMSWLRVDELRQDLGIVQKNQAMQVISEHFKQVTSVSFI